MSAVLKPEEHRFCVRCGTPLSPRVVHQGEPARPACPACGHVVYLDPKLAAGAIVILEGQIVLLRRSIQPGLGKYVFPGGFVDRGESPQAAAVREVREEVGLRVALLGILDAYLSNGGDTVVIAYAADVLGGELTAGPEAQEVATFAPESLPWEELAFDSTKAALRDYVRRYFPRVRLPR